MRLDDVEIKVTFGREQTEAAVHELQLPAGLSNWQIYFCEDVNAGAPGAPLLDANVVLRARVRPDDAEDDVTVKLRPCRGSQLPSRWMSETKKLKVEADWAGDRHVLAASHTDQRNKSVIPAVAAGERPLSDLFSDQQLDFLAECAGTFINLDTLTVLAPITAVRWKDIPVAPQNLELRAERWTIGDLDFLELSAVAPVEEALAKQEAMQELVASLGLTTPPEQATKTRQVLEHLVHASL